VALKTKSTNMAKSPADHGSPIPAPPRALGDPLARILAKHKKKAKKRRGDMNQSLTSSEV
jgi:hypothetical protein